MTSYTDRERPVRRGVLRIAALAAAWPLRGHAQSFPARPIRIVVPSPPGDGSDLVARAIAQRLAEAWGQPVVVNNRPGAGGRIGTEAVVRAAADGYTWLMGNAGSNGINAAIYPDLPYDLERDLVPVTQVMRAPNVLVVNPSLGVAGVQEFVALLKSNPGRYAYGSGGNGSSAHLSAELFRMMAGVEMQHVPYKGAGPAMTDLIAGQIAMFLGNLPPAIGHIRTGRLRALGVSTMTRSPLLPDTPTLHESGLTGFETVAWFALFAPAAVPSELVGRMRDAVARIVTVPEIGRQIETLGGEPVAGTPAALREVVRADIAKWKRVVAAAKITVQ